jgi:hypothetical protein
MSYPALAFSTAINQRRACEDLLQFSTRCLQERRPPAGVYPIRALPDSSQMGRRPQLPQFRPASISSGLFASSASRCRCDVVQLRLTSRVFERATGRTRSDRDEGKPRMMDPATRDQESNTYGIYHIDEGNVEAYVAVRMSRVKRSSSLG